MDLPLSDHSALPGASLFADAGGADASAPAVTAGALYSLAFEAAGGGSGGLAASMSSFFGTILMGTGSLGSCEDHGFLGQAYQTVWAAEAADRLELVV